MNEYEVISQQEVNLMSFEDNLLLTVTKFLAIQKNEFDKKIAAHLPLCQLDIENTGQWSGRSQTTGLFRYWVIGNLHVPTLRKQFFTKKVVKRLEEVFKYFYPEDKEQDLEGLVITPKLEEAYEGWQQKAIEFLSDEDRVPYDSFDERMLHTVVEYLKYQDNDQDKLIASHLAFCKLSYEEDSQNNPYEDYSSICVAAHLFVPLQNYSFFTDEVVKRLEEVFRVLAPKNADYPFGYVTISIQTEFVYEGWQEQAFLFLTGQGVTNQASSKITSPVVYEHNGVRVRSKGELAILQALERRKDCLYFPLPLALCGTEYKEPDFLICYEGKWGILEVISDWSHQSSTKDAERERWFQKHLIVKIQEYDAEDCKANPDKVVDEFLNWLSRL